MQILRSRIDTRQRAFQQNREQMLGLLAEIEQQLAVARAGGGEKYVARHRARGRLLPRERIELLVDQDSAFLELSPLAGWGSEYTVGGSIVTGIGVISGVECMIQASDPTVRGGTSNPYTVKKTLRSFEIARANRLPVIQLTESGGADLPRQAEIFVPGGRTFFEITRLSGERIPTVSIVFGNATAGGAYVPGMSDYTVFIRGQSHAFLGGPPLVKMATGEDAEEEALGGGEMHARVSGLADFLAEDEYEAIGITRDLVESWSWRKLGPAPTEPPDDPVYDPEELLGVASVDLRVPFDAREVIARVVDGSRFHEFKPLYGETLVTGFAHIEGYPVAILANNGILFSQSALKGAHFIELAVQRQIPLVFLQNITGFMVGRDYEAGGIAKDGAKMVTAVACAEVPKFTVIIGGSFGAGNYAMAGRAYSPRFLWT
ncbi:MAG: acyl-CoA carboxylase subunit beta, partial [Dehalococcoidia bacterium]|nr:acyl-CoA carboxylase subunit beta [Dehalococcoidia bacterium]